MQTLPEDLAHQPEAAAIKQQAAWHRGIGRRSIPFGGSCSNFAVTTGYCSCTESGPLARPHLRCCGSGLDMFCGVVRQFNVCLRGALVSIVGIPQLAVELPVAGPSTTPPVAAWFQKVSAPQRTVCLVM